MYRFAYFMFLIVTLVPGSTGKASGADAINIGLVRPATGPFAEFGEQLSMGAAAAVEAINAAGGVGGTKIQLVVVDDQCDPRRARSVANELLNDGVLAVIGHFCSGATVAASDVYNSHNLLMITPASTNPLVTDRGLPTVFRAVGRDDQQGSITAAWIATQLKPMTVAIFNDKTSYGRNLAAEMQKTLSDTYRIKVISYEGIDSDDKNYSFPINNLKAQNVDLVFLSGYFPKTASFARQAYQRDLKVKFVGGIPLATIDFIGSASKMMVTSQTLTTLGPDASRIPEAKVLVEQFKSKGYNPIGYTLYSYAAVQSIAKALAANNNTRDGKKLGEWLKNNRIDTVLGTQEWDNKGDTKNFNYKVDTWVPKNGIPTHIEYFVSPRTPQGLILMQLPDPCTTCSCLPQNVCSEICKC